MFTLYKSYRQCWLLLASLLLAGSVLAREPGRAAIASAHPLATQAGYDILAQGGNAFDAAVAVAGALAVVEPQSSGLGGGGFFLLHIAAENRDVFVDAREVAPQAATADMYLDAAGQPRQKDALNGPLAAGIPGHAAGLVHLAGRYGRLPLADSLVPAIGHAEEGFLAYRRMLVGLRFRQKTAALWPAFNEVFYPQGVVPPEGTLIRQPDLAASLRRLAAEGASGFYAGETAQRLVDGVRDAGGIWTLEDLARYRVVEREPVTGEYHGVRIVSAPPPSSGGIAIINMLNMLSGFDLAQLSDADRKHVTIEAMRRAYRDRAQYLGDPRFVDVPVERLLHPFYASGQRASIRMDRATASATLPGVWPTVTERPQTTHFSVLDAQGNRVAATLTINGWYGSAFMPPGTGMILNNEMDDFAIAPGVPNGFQLIGSAANAVAPGKRPLSSMAPTFLESERGVAILGTPGGSRIITMVLLSSLAWMEGATADEMVSRKRFHHQYFPDRVTAETGALSEAEQTELAARGHELQVSPRGFGNMNVVTWDYATGEVAAATDPRGEVTIEGRVY
jgi:gamma-glutamyltranspeptidase/glutathione hydrolase